MKSYYLLYLPALFFFALPIINLFQKERAARRKQKQKEEQRHAAQEAKLAATLARKAAKEAKTATLAADPVPHRKPGRPRKDPQAQRLETISGQHPAPLPSSCTPEQFAAWIKN